MQPDTKSLITAILAHGLLVSGQAKYGKQAISEAVKLAEELLAEVDEYPYKVFKDGKTIYQVKDLEHATKYRDELKKEYPGCTITTNFEDKVYLDDEAIRHSETTQRTISS